MRIPGWYKRSININNIGMERRDYEQVAVNDRKSGRRT